MTKETKVCRWAGLDQADYQFHYEIVKASGHALLIRAYENCHIQVTGLRSAYTNLKQFPMNATAKDHSTIVECIAAADAKGAARAAHEHVFQALRVVEAYLGMRLDSTSDMHIADS